MAFVPILLVVIVLEIQYSEKETASVMPATLVNNK